MLCETPENLFNSVMPRVEKTAATAVVFPEKVTFEDLLVSIGETRSRDSFVRLFEYFAPRIKSFLIKGGMTHETADELAQETMLTVWQKAAQYDPARAGAATWIFTIARNKRIDALRKKGASLLDIDDFMIAADTPPPDEEISQNQQNEHLAQAIRALPPEQADLVAKAFFEEKTHAAIAAESGLPLGTVKSRLRLALEKLRRQLETAEKRRPQKEVQ